MSRLSTLRDNLSEAEQLRGLELSIGDTPSCSVVEDLSAVEEIRPGNFVYYDVMQTIIGSCSEDDIAVAVACPVVSKNGSRRQIVVYGRWRAPFQRVDGGSPGAHDLWWRGAAYRRRLGADPGNTYVRSLSQEHGVISADRIPSNG